MFQEITNIIISLKPLSTLLTNSLFFSFFNKQCFGNHFPCIKILLFNAERPMPNQYKQCSYAICSDMVYGFTIYLKPAMNELPSISKEERKSLTTKTLFNFLASEKFIASYFQSQVIQIILRYFKHIPCQYKVDISLNFFQFLRLGTLTKFLLILQLKNGMKMI